MPDWRCPGCGTLVLEDEVRRHVNDCDEVTGDGQRIPDLPDEAQNLLELQAEEAAAEAAAKEIIKQYQLAYRAVRNIADECQFLQDPQYSTVLSLVEAATTLLRLIGDQAEGVFE